MTAILPATEQIATLRTALRTAILTNADEKAALWEEYRRLALQQRILARWGEETNREQQVLLYGLAAKSRFFFARTFGHVVEPRNAVDGKETLLPFIPFLHQEWASQFFHQALIDKTTALALKVRDMGLTWQLLTDIVHDWLFMPGFTCHLGSRTEDLVDSNTASLNPDTLMGRVEIILDNLPTYMLPRGFTLLDKSLRQQNQLINPENGNRITGEASSPHFSRQMRGSLMLGDEIDFWPDTAAVWGATRDSFAARWFITTPNRKGDGTVKAVVQEKRARILELPWTYHPLKTHAWHEAERAERFEDELSTELGLSWEGSDELRLYPEWDLVDKGAFPYRPDWPTFGFIDFGRADGTGIGYAQRNPATRRLRFLAAHYRAGETIDFFFPFFGRPIASGIHDYTEEERALIQDVQRWARGGIAWFGDPAGRQHTQAANLSVIEQLAQQKVYITTNPQINNFDQRRDATRLLLRNAECNIERCRRLDDAMKGYRRAPQQAGTITPQRRPIHNWASHLCTAVEYLAVNLPEARQAKKSEEYTRHRAAWER